MKVDVIHDSEDHITEAALRASTTNLIDPGSVLVVTRSGILQHTLPVATTSRSVTINQDVKALTPQPGLVPEYVAWGLRANARRILRECSKAGTTVQSVETTQLLRFVLSIAPTAEQKRIVAAIEEQFSRLDSGALAIERVRERLRLLRDGGLMALITPSGDSQRLGDVAEIRLGRQRSPKNHTGPRLRPYLRAANVTWNGLDLKDVKSMNFSPAESLTYELQRGDVLVAEASGSASEVGKPAIWDGSIANCCFQNTLLRIRSERFLPEYLYFVLLAHARGGTFARASRGVGIHHLSKSGLSALAVSVPELTQQEAIIQQARSLQNAVTRLLGDIEKQAVRLGALRSAILAAAFSGRLVDQDPTDEPAKSLLGRIVAERESSNGDKVVRARTKRTRPSKVSV